MNKEQLINEILIVIKANNIPITGDIFFALLFRNERELENICQGLGVNLSSENSSASSNAHSLVDSESV